MRPDARIRPIVPAMQWVLLGGSFLVVVAGIPLFFTSERTDSTFAWHIKNPLTAAFLGAFYFAALLMALPSSRQRSWARARVGIPGVLAFLWLTMVATLLHLDQFHLDHGGSFARFAAWAWLVVYVTVPVFDTVAFVRQVKAPGADPPPTRRLPPWFRRLLAIQGAVSVLVGIVLFAFPTTARVLWSWSLTPLTARATAAWLVAVGGTLLTASWEDDWDAIRPALIAYAGLGALQFVALARYGDLVDWRDPAAWLYVSTVASVMLAGLFGLTQARPARSSGPIVTVGS
jgi:hypothetical protein